MKMLKGDGKMNGFYLKVGRFNWYPMVLLKNLLRFAIVMAALWPLASWFDVVYQNLTGRALLMFNYWTILFKFI